MITRTKYRMLKKHQGALTEEEISEVKEFEEYNAVKYQKNNKEYFERLNNFNNPENFVVKYEVLINKFLEKYKEIEGVYFNGGENNEMLDNLNTILYYFAKDKRFFECKNLSSQSKPSFEKGLLIIGNYGCGKTSIMRVLKQLFDHTPLSFKMYTSNKIVSTFESYNDAEARAGYISRTKTGIAYFDDIKTEKIASNYGLYNLIKEIIEERYISKIKTYITCNYRDDDDEMSLDDALKEFDEKYGPRVYDRLFQMFNIIEFNGKSMRK